MDAAKQYLIHLLFHYNASFLLLIATAGGNEFAVYSKKNT